MTNFEDQLLSDLMTEHGAQLTQPGSRPATGTSQGGRRLAAMRRPGWLITGAAGLAAAATAAVLALGGTTLVYAVSQAADGTVQVSVSQPSGVAKANAALQLMQVRIRVVKVRAGCPSISSLPHVRGPHRQSVSFSTGKSKGGGQTVSVKLSGQGIPAGATVILAFTTNGRTNLGAGGWITGPVPNCVSLPRALGQQSGS